MRKSPWLTEQQIWTLIHSPDRRHWRGRRDAALLSLLAVGALRSHEASALKVEQLEETPDGLRIMVFGKGDKERPVTIPRPGSDFVLGWIERNGSPELVFPSRKGAPLTDKAVREIVKSYGGALGFDTVRNEDGIDRTLHPHALRHSALKMLVHASSDIYRAQRLAGHSDPKTTAQYYLKFAPKDADETAAIMRKALAHRKPRGRPRKARRAA